MATDKCTFSANDKHELEKKIHFYNPNDKAQQL